MNSGREMSEQGLDRPRLLVAINNYGDGHRDYLSRLIAEYRSMPYQTDIVVLSNIPKDLGPGIEVVVGLPTKNPWSLAFGHKKIFADRVDLYDLFIYTEDDILITERNIDAFLQVSTVLPDEEAVGFFRKEIDRNGILHYPEAHGSFHWDPQSVRSVGEYTLAFFTNEHSGCYILTQRQLQKAIASGGFLVPPHAGRYDMACSAATDPYTRCGLKKFICISHFDDFLVHHIPNKYVDEYGLAEPGMRRQIEVLLGFGQNGAVSASPFTLETKLMGSRYSKDYYEPARDDIAALISSESRSVLSLGCGRGLMETLLATKGFRVVAVPIDPIISAGAEAQRIEIIKGDLRAARQKLEGQHFDCLLLSNILHLVEDPVELLSFFKDVLVENGRVIATVPNVSRLPEMWRRIQGHEHVKGLGSYRNAGVHVTSRRIVREWFEVAGLSVEGITNVLTPRLQKASHWTLGLADSLLAIELIVVARNA
jgi:SAM-dependent methyltransferase